MSTTPPSARRVVCVDFDGTIAPWGDLFGLPDPFPGVPEAMRKLDDWGYHIVILTSRMSATWLEKDHERFGFDTADEFRRANRTYLTDYLNKYHIPFAAITAQKVAAEAYMDDHAVYAGKGTLPHAINMLLDGFDDE